VLQNAVYGLLLGSNYALLAVGYTLVFGVTRLLTLAHGQVFMVSGALALLAMRAFDLPLLPAIAIAIAVGGAAGVLTDLLCFRPVSRESELAPAVATIGLALALQNSLELLRGSSNPIGLPTTFHASEIHLGSVLVSTPQLAMFILAVVVMASIGWFIRSTRWGAALRGMGEDPATVELLGINSRGLGTVVLGVSGMLAGVAGILVAVRVGNVGLTVGTDLGLKGLAIMAIAGLGSLSGAVLVGMAVGIIEHFATYYQLGWIEPIVPWILVVAVLLLRPQGLFSRARSS
jgi:branched-subunit amino acid ABC-type transport system permease component